MRVGNGVLTALDNPSINTSQALAQPISKDERVSHNYLHDINLCLVKSKIYFKINNNQHNSNSIEMVAFANILQKFPYNFLPNFPLGTNTDIFFKIRRRYKGTLKFNYSNILSYFLAPSDGFPHFPTIPPPAGKFHHPLI